MVTLVSTFDDNRQPIVGRYHTSLVQVVGDSLVLFDEETQLAIGGFAPGEWVSFKVVDDV